MGIATENIKGIIAAAQPNSNLISRTMRPIDADQQRAREQKLYNKIRMVDPITNEPIQTIEQLNALILHLDKLYNFEALLPTGSMGNGGEVERILSNPPYNYNLKLRGKNKFTRNEQIKIKDRLQALADEAFRILSNSGEFYAGLTNAAAAKLWPQILAYMGALQVKSGIMTLFLNTTMEKQDRNVKDIYDTLLDGAPVEAIRMRTFLENVQGTKRTTSREGFGFKRNEFNDIIGIEFNPDLNELSSRTFSDFYEFAIREGLLENDIDINAQNSIGTGSVSPMDVSPDKWRNDVYEAVYQALTKDGTPLDSDELKKLLDQYKVADEIALGRSLSNLRGFTGELRAILLTHLLFPAGSGSLAGTSKVVLENSFRKGEAPLDVVIKLMDQVFGIQVKNISDLESYSWGNIRDSKGMSIPSFYAERLQSALDTREINFFGAYVYNQPVSDYPNPYESVYAGFQSTFDEKFVPVYKKMALYIIRQTTEIKQSDNPLLSGTLKNDLFFMNNKVVPASAFMDALNKDSDMITSSFTITKPAIGYYRSSAKQPADYNSYTNKAMIRYEIEVQYARLLTSAYNVS